MSELHVVIGGTGGAGNAVVDELIARGKRVRATSRRPPANDPRSVEWVDLDAQAAADVERACAGAGVVYHCANVPYSQWDRMLVPIADAIISAAGKAGAKLVVMDNLYMYGPVEGPITETTPHRPVGHKGRLRGELQTRYLSAHRAGKVKVTIGRASDFYGGTGLSAVTMLVIDPVLQGRSASWIARLDVLHTLSYLPDVGWGLVTLGEQAQALGDVWHLPAAEPLTGRQFITMVCEAANKRTRMTTIGKPLMFVAGLFDSQIREALEVYYQWERPFVLDASKFTRAFGSRITPHAEAIAATIGHRRRRLSAAHAWND